jgi:hypothetical protein
MDVDPSSMKDFFVEPQKGVWLVSEMQFVLPPCHIFLHLFIIVYLTTLSVALTIYC